MKILVTNDLQNITAFRLELLTDPNLPCNGPGRSFKGTCALTEFKVEALDAKAPTNKSQVKFVSATADYEQPEARSNPISTTNANKKRVTGPVKFAIDGNDETAWGIDAGPGRRNQARKAVFQCATNVGFADGTVLDLHLTQNHGGWNSDELMNNNLGRFRISVTTNRVRSQPTRFRSAFANICPSARTSLAGAGRDSVQLLAHDRSRFQGSQ